MPHRTPVSYRTNKKTIMNNTNLASRIVAGVQSASPELLADLSLCITLAAEAHPSEAAAYWLSIAAEMRSTSYERRTGA